MTNQIGLKGYFFHNQVGQVCDAHILIPQKQLSKNDHKWLIELDMVFKTYSFSWKLLIL